MQVARLSTTPVKGLALSHPEHVDLTRDGVAGDREFFLVTDEGGLISCTDLGELMRHRARYDAGSRTLEVHGPAGLMRSAVVEQGAAVQTDFYGLRTVTAHVVPGWDDLFSEIGGRALRLVHGETGGYDVRGVSLLGSASTATLAGPSGAVDGRRFRMNVEIDGSAAHDEDAWDGRELRLGDAIVRVGGPIKRCAATTRDPDTGVVDLQTLRLIRAARGRQETPEFGFGFYFGVYADVVTPGRVRVGDEVELAG